MHLKFFTFINFLLASSALFGQVNVTFPPSRMVYQRDQSGDAKVFINGTYLNDPDQIQARLKTRDGEPGFGVDWTTIVSNPSGYIFSGSLNARGGRFDLEVRTMKNGEQIGNSTIVEKVGVGEVFLIVGHSNAAKAESEMKPASSDLVNTIDPNANVELYNKYLESGSPADLPPLAPVQFCLNCGIAPMAQYPWFWTQLGDLLVSSLNVPVLFYSAAFGGSSMGHLYKAAYNINFDHGFIKYSIRMPYVNIRNTITTYMPRTGLRAILSAHGVNDGDTTGAGFYFRNKMVIEKSRSEANYDNLPWMIATSCYNNGINQEKTDAQNALINEIHDVFRGADLNQIGQSGRYDGLHFNEEGQRRAAELWRDAITNPQTNLLGNARSLMATAPPLPGPPLPVDLVSFTGQKDAAGRNRLTWVTSSEENNDYFEVQRSLDAVNFEVIGQVKGFGDSRVSNTYTYADEQVSERLTYYRLYQVDYDGKASLSSIVAVKTAIARENDFVYPNPAQHFVEVVLNNGATVDNLNVFDLSGKLLIQKEKTSQLDISALGKGAYIVEIKTNGGQSVRKKITKM
ncbi:T9SS type A sorting domain-containing protein [Dyadobacter sp. Leaf189]|uniref:T9SS type A sorting domain-containing protein n=1 Tax=Dyadobacter sp. Leaf189 TaxID=1736295 RepID=UPI0006F25DC5|nr:T9SS type A sorting domain-containing protein [Dyadobacter sp. Leaf189]KQS31209.1 hypothetical protein ASG33_12815 [Dyadobacter sp. Leaf189]